MDALQIQAENQILKAKLEEYEQDIKMIGGAVISVMEQLDITEAFNGSDVDINSIVRSKFLPLVMDHFAPSMFSKNKKSKFSEAMEPLTEVIPVLVKYVNQFKESN